MLKVMATPTGRAPHEVGAGFVDGKTASSYLRSFGAKSFVQLFSRRDLTADENTELDQLNLRLGPFSSEQEIEMIFKFCWISKIILAIDISTMKSAILPRSLTIKGMYGVAFERSR
jgi:hypothetical protein